jgi:hypothetical protein
MSTDPREVITIKEEVVIMGMAEGEATVAITQITGIGRETILPVGILQILTKQSFKRLSPRLLLR